MKVVVTGGAGFIGSHLVEKLLKDNHKITIIDNLSTGHRENIDKFFHKITFYNQDLSTINKKDLDKILINNDIIFHLAALADIVPSIQLPEKYFNSNVIGTFKLLESCVRVNIKKIIYSASSSCYGIPNNYPTNEESPEMPQYPYALTKLIAEKTIMHWAAIYGLEAVSLRFFNVYGTRSRTSGTYGAMFGVFLAQKLANKPFTVVGDGEQTRDFTYVTDVVGALVRVMDSDVKTNIFNIGSGKTISVNKIVDLLKGNKITVPKRPGEPDCTFADISKITRETGWQPKISIEEGIDILLKEIDYWKNAPVWTPETIKTATEDWFKYLGKKS